MQREKSNSMFQSGRVYSLPVSCIHPNPSQPRRCFSQSGLQELAASIACHGILQPLSVRRCADGYELVAGERRLRAAKLAGLAQVPCLLLNVDDTQAGMLALVENLQRRDLDFIEEAEGIARLIRLYGISQEQAAAQLGKSQSAVANKLRLLRHSPAVLAALREQHLSERHARALLRLPTEQARLSAIEFIAKNDLNVAKSEAYIESLLQTPPPRRGMRKFVLKDVRLFLNAVDHNLALMKSAGIPAASRREETDAAIILTITIPKKSNSIGA